MSAGYHIPAQRLTWHHSTTVPGAYFELVDNHMDGFQERFIVRSYVAGTLISETPFAAEVAARKEFERRVEQHYAR